MVLLLIEKIEGNFQGGLGEAELVIGDCRLHSQPERWEAHDFI
jgi:hypothetical protein